MPASKGFEEGAKADSSFEYLGVQYSHNDPAEAAKLVSAALAKDPDIVGVFATNMFAAEGTATGVRQAGKQDQVKIVGFDAGPAQVKQLQDGTVQALIAQEPASIGTARRRAGRRRPQGRVHPEGNPDRIPSRSPRTTSTVTAPSTSTSPAANKPPGAAGCPLNAGSSRPHTPIMKRRMT